MQHFAKKRRATAEPLSSEELGKKGKTNFYSLKRDTLSHFHFVLSKNYNQSNCIGKFSHRPVSSYYCLQSLPPSASSSLTCKVGFLCQNYICKFAWYNFTCRKYICKSAKCNFTCRKYICKSAKCNFTCRKYICKSAKCNFTC